MLQLFKKDPKALQNYLKNKKKKHKRSHSKTVGFAKSMDLRKVADMYNGDLVKPDGLTPARIESMHSPKNVKGAKAPA